MDNQIPPDSRKNIETSEKISKIREIILRPQTEAIILAVILAFVLPFILGLFGIPLHIGFNVINVTIHEIGHLVACLLSGGVSSGFIIAPGGGIAYCSKSNAFIDLGGLLSSLIIGVLFIFLMLAKCRDPNPEEATYSIIIGALGLQSLACAAYSLFMPETFVVGGEQLTSDFVKAALTLNIPYKVLIVILFFVLMGFYVFAFWIGKRSIFKKK